MRKRERCPRLLNELWTPGRIGSPDGKPRTMQGQCVLPKDHGDEGRSAGGHIYGDWHEHSA